MLTAAESLQVTSEEAARALYLGHAANLYVKSYMGSISCVCGAVSAGAGVAAAISWLLSRDVSQVKKAINVVLSALYGMICDGAKASCALKGSVGAIQGLNEMCIRDSLNSLHCNLSFAPIRANIRNLPWMVSGSHDFFGGIFVE